jgi:hypothetical protein
MPALAGAEADREARLADPVVQREVRPGVEARPQHDRVDRERDDRHRDDAEDERQDEAGDGPAPAPERDQAGAGALAGDRHEGAAGADDAVVHVEHQHAEQDHDERGEVADAGALADQVGVQRRRQHELAHRAAEEGRRPEGAEAAREGEQEGREDRRQHQRQHDAPQDRGAAGAEQLGRLLELGVDVAQRAADQHEPEGEVVQRERDRDREQAVGEPVRRDDAGEGGEEALRAADAGVLEERDPGQGQRPRRHDVGDDRGVRDQALERQVGAHDQPRQRAADRQGQEGQAERDDQRVDQRAVEERVGVLAHEGALPVRQRECRRASSPGSGSAPAGGR